MEKEIIERLKLTESNRVTSESFLAGRIFYNINDNKNLFLVEGQWISGGGNDDTVVSIFYHKNKYINGAVFSKEVLKLSIDYVNKEIDFLISQIEKI